MSATGTRMADNYFLHVFSQLTEDLLSTLHDAFPECGGTKQCLSLYQLFAKVHLNTLVGGIKVWYSIMSPYTKNLLNKDEGFLWLCEKLRQNHQVPNANLQGLMNVMLAGTDTQKKAAVKEFCHPVNMLNYMKLEEKWSHPELDEQSREYLFTYIVHMNAYATLYEIVPDVLIPDVVSMIKGTPSENNFLSQMMSKFANRNGNETANVNNTTLPEIPPEQLRHFMSHMQEFYLAFGCLNSEGTSPLTNLMEDMGLPKDAIKPESMEKLSKVLNKLPEGTMQAFVEAMYSGDYKVFMNPQILHSIAEACRESEVSIQEVMGSVDLSKLMGHLQSSGMMNDPAFAQVLKGAMGSMGGVGAAGAAGALGSISPEMLGNIDPAMIQTMMSAMTGDSGPSSATPNPFSHEDML